MLIIISLDSVFIIELVIFHYKFLKLLYDDDDDDDDYYDYYYCCWYYYYWIFM